MSRDSARRIRKGAILEYGGEWIRVAWVGDPYNDYEAYIRDTDGRLFSFAEVLDMLIEKN